MPFGIAFQLDNLSFLENSCIQVKLLISKDHLTNNSDEKPDLYVDQDQQYY